MSWHWKELRPIDHYLVRKGKYISGLDRLTLTLLYQPLIGALAHSLYVTLFSQLERDQYWSHQQTHRHLMTILGVSLEIILEERKKLEGIGLLKTYQKKEQERLTFLYELQPPMSPKEFFENDVLSVFLYNRLGKSEYQRLRERFIIDVISTDDFEELTYAFDEVFTSLHHSEMVSNLQSESRSALQISNDKELVSIRDHEQLSFIHQSFDYDLFKKSLTNTIVPERALTEEVLDFIGRLAFVYQMEPLEMSHVVSQVYIHSDELDRNELRKRIQDWYKIEHSSHPPELGLRTHPKEHQTQKNQKPQTEEERAIQFYETIAPLTLLEIHANGAEVALEDVKIIESLMIDYQLLPGVINILLEYMLYNHDMKLPKALIHKIAGHWSRKNITTVQEAMSLVQVEEKKAIEMASKGTGTRKNNRPQARREKLPKWLIAEQQQEQQSVQKKKNTNIKNNETTSLEKSYELMLEQLSQK